LPQSEMYFRMPLLLFSGLSAVLALWILVTQLSLGEAYGLPTSAETAAAARVHRHDAALAASIGIIRGELWARSAFTYADLFWDNPIKPVNTSVDDAGSANAARRILGKALSYAPHRADVWLAFAAIGSRFNWQNPDPASALKMAFYTGPSETSLIPMRLVVAAQSNALNDTDVQQFVRRDIRLVLLRVPDLKPAIQSAYREATSANRRIIESAVNDLDPTFVELLRANSLRKP
jgi:hypothetical protein